MPDPKIAGRAPLPIDVEAGKAYYWCTCGESKNQPFCDGSHKGSEFAPLAWTPAKSGQVWLCTCKQTKNQPLCDGSHKALS
jgi:CDGSH-type Zn-finger protein